MNNKDKENYLTGIKINGHIAFYKHRNNEDKNVEIEKEKKHGQRIIRQIKEAITEILNQEHGLCQAEEHISFYVDRITVKQKNIDMEKVFFID